MIELIGAALGFAWGAGSLGLERRRNRRYEQEQRREDRLRQMAERRDVRLSIEDRGRGPELVGDFARRRDVAAMHRVDVDVATEMIGPDEEHAGYVFPDGTWIGGRN